MYHSLIVLLEAVHGPSKLHVVSHTVSGRGTDMPRIALQRLFSRVMVWLASEGGLGLSSTFARPLLMSHCLKFVPSRTKLNLETSEL